MARSATERTAPPTRTSRRLKPAILHGPLPSFAWRPVQAPGSAPWSGLSAEITYVPLLDHCPLIRVREACTIYASKDDLPYDPRRAHEAPFFRKMHGCSIQAWASVPACFYPF